MITTDAHLSLMDLITRNLVHSMNEQVFVLSGVNYLGMITSEMVFISGLLNMLGYAIYPLALGLGLPVFMFTIVYEKETKTKLIMKMHGMREMNYWLISIFFNFCLYSISVSVFLFFAIFVFKIGFFIETKFIIIVSFFY